MPKWKVREYKNKLIRCEGEMWKCEDETHEIMCAYKGLIIDFALDMFAVTFIYAIAIAYMCVLCY